MTDQPFQPGGIITSPGPDSDLVLAPLSPSGAFLRLEDWPVRDEREAEDADEHC